MLLWVKGGRNEGGGWFGILVRCQFLQCPPASGNTSPLRRVLTEAQTPTHPPSKTHPPKPPHTTKHRLHSGYCLVMFDFLSGRWSGFPHRSTTHLVVSLLVVLSSVLSSVFLSSLSSLLFLSCFFVFFLWPPFVCKFKKSRV